MSNSYIARLREEFADEIKHDPYVANLILAMMITEDAVHPLSVLESLFNRTNYVNAGGWKRTLAQMITGGFYGPYNRREYPRALAEMRMSPVLQVRLNKALDDALAGSNSIEGYTDQGLPTDPNGRRLPQMRIGGDVFNDWAGGPGGAKGAEAWRQDFLSQAFAADKSASNVEDSVLPQGEVLSPAGYPSVKEEDHTIIALQEALNKMPLGVGKLDVDGIEGQRTQNAVRAFQRFAHIDVDGIAGEVTWAELKKRLGDG
jgi:peptidoglycan hydrolase-like protein with peptidoglycan-binding domain